MKKLSIDEIKLRIEKVHGDMIIIDELLYKNTHQRTRFIDKEYGEFWNTIKNVLHGQGHPKRAREKLEATNLKKYGVRRPMQSEEIREKTKAAWVEKFGVDNPAKAEETKEKMRLTNLEVRGVEWAGQSEEVKDKIVATNMEKYGVAVSSQAEEVKEKQKQTNIERYGAGCVMQAPGIKEKIIEGFIIKFGFDNPMKNAEVREKQRLTVLNHYGVEYTFQAEEIKEKSRQTSLDHFGVDHPQKNKEISLKSARGRNTSVIKIHWLDTKELVCTASYEPKVVDYFNENKINFIWQGAVFVMPDGRTYRPDFYLPDTDTWGEIKGHFWKDAEEKWNWFHAEYPNSELWDKEKLKSLGLL